LPKNDGIEKEEAQEVVYNEDGEFEAVYNFTCITILNADGSTRVIWGLAADAYPYDVPKLRFVFDS